MGGVRLHELSVRLPALLKCPQPLLRFLLLFIDSLLESLDFFLQLRAAFGLGAR
jgi:hypothetical protein